MALQPFRIFNGEVKNKATKIFGGESSGIRDWDDVKYPAMLDVNKELFGEYWIENEIRLGDDLVDYRQKLTDRERYVYNVITGYLTALDSFATDLNFILGYICTDSSVRSNIALIDSFEILHNRSYQYLTSTMLNAEEKRQAFNAPKEIPALVKRNKSVIDRLQRLTDKMSEYIFKKEIDDELLQIIFEAIVANVVLEGLYFTGGFAYFHSLARDNKMLSSNNMINLIKADETQHNAFFGMILRIMMLEYPQLNTQENMNNTLNFIDMCVGMEKEWAEELFEGIDTISIGEYNDYIEYLANVICRNAGIKELYPDNQELKSNWIIKYGSKKRDNGVATRVDFFQSDVIDYGHEGGDGFDL